MTNEEIQQIIFASERKLRFRYGLEPTILWVIAAFCLVAGLISHLVVASYAMLLISSGLGIGLWSLHRTDVTRRQLREFEVWKTLLLWRQIHRSKMFGSTIRGTALSIRERVDQIYSMRSGEHLLPLSHAIRLLDVCVRQQTQLKPINARRFRLYTLRQKFETKIAQLQGLGANREKSPEERQLDFEIEWTENARYEISSSCDRLYNIIEQVHREAQARQLRDELDDLQSQLPRAIPSRIEPSFEAESLEEIERQIGREIETYLRLERETEEHLR